MNGQADTIWECKLSRLGYHESINNSGFELIYTSLKSCEPLVCPSNVNTALTHSAHSMHLRCKHFCYCTFKFPTASILYDRTQERRSAIKPVPIFCLQHTNKGIVLNLSVIERSFWMGAEDYYHAYFLTTVSQKCVKPIKDLLPRRSKRTKRTSRNSKRCRPKRVF